jgi:ribosomal protein L7/L12
MIKDFSGKISPIANEILTSHKSGLTNELVTMTFILYKPGSQKLALVKAIKFVTGLGLKDSKDMVDESMNHPIMFRQKLTLGQLDEFRNQLSITDAEFDLDDREKIRNKKLIDLGIYEKSDLVSELINMDIQKVFIGGFSTTKLREIIESIYDNISEERLREIYDNYKL